MTTSRQFIFSCSTFGGFQLQLDVAETMTLDETVKAAVSQLKDLLSLWHFDALVSILKTKKYHIHSHSMNEIIHGNVNMPVYICPCCAKEEIAK